MRILPRDTLSEYGPTNKIIQTTFVYRPGSIPKYNVYNDWEKLIADAELVAGPKIIEIDDSIVSPAPIPEGTYDLKDATIVGSSRDKNLKPIMSLVDNTIFTNLERIEFLEIEADLTLPIFLATSSSQIILKDVELSVLSGGSEIFGSNSIFDLILDGTTVNGPNPVLSVIDGVTNIWLYNHSKVFQDTISAESDTIVNLYLVDANNYFESQAGILGTYSIIKKSEAEQVNIVDVGSNYVSTDVENALQEIGDSRGQPDGLATLDHLGKVPLDQLPTPFPLNFKGFWDANTNTPDIDFAPIQGDAWIINVSGTTNLDGINDWQVGDWAIYNGSVWYKLDNSNFVLSVNGYTGDVILTKSDIGLSNVENTALSTWPGTTNITTVGNITTGTWSGSTIAIDHGGTGLSATPTNGQILIGNGTGYTLNTLTDGTGINITEGSGSITIANTGTLTVGATAPIASSGGQNPTISINNSGIVAGSYGTASSVPTINFTAKGLATSASNTPIAIDGSQVTSGTVPVDHGGTGVSTIPSNGQLLIGNGTGYTVATLTDGTGVNITEGSGSITIANTGVLTVGGVAPIASSGGQNPDISINDSGIIAGSYGTASSVPTISFTAKGLATSASNTSIAIDASQITSGTLPVIRGGTGLSTAGGTPDRVIYTADGINFTTGLLPNAALSNSSLTVTAGTGLSGGGLVSLGGSTTLNIANTTVVAGSYGTASSVPTFTVNAQGQLTAASNTAIAISASQVTGGTLPNTVSVQNVYQTVTAAISGGSAALTFGQVVYLKNSGGSASSPAVDLALGSSSTSLNTIGLVASTTIPNNNTGSVVTYGVIVGTPAVPLNTNAYTQGDTLYVDTTTAGALTNIPPTYPNLAIPVGIVIVRNATQGAIYVNSNIGLNAAPQIKMPAPSVKTTLSAPATTSILKSVFAPPTVSAIEYLVLDFSGAGNVTLSAGPIEALTAADYGRKLTIHNISTKTITFNSGGTAYLSGGVNLVLPANGIVSFVWSFVGGGVGRWVQLAPAITVS